MENENMNRAYLNKPESKLKYMEVVVEGFVIAPNRLIKEKDVLAAIVWGKIWGFSQMKDGVCSAALEKLSGLLGISYRTVMRRTEWLEKNGYIEDLTPGRRNAPHEYIPTDKIKPSFAFGIVDKSEAGVTESHSEVRQRVIARYDRESHEDINVNKPLNKQVKRKLIQPVYVDVDEINVNPRRKAKAPKKNNPKEVPDSYPANVASLAVVFEEIIKRRPLNNSEWVFWVYGSSKSNAKGLADFVKLGISGDAMRSAAVKLSSGTNKITIASPNTLFNTAHQIQSSMKTTGAETNESLKDLQERARQSRIGAKKIQVEI